MKKIIDKNFTAFTLSYDEEKALIKAKGRDLKIIFGQDTMDYAFIGGLLFDEQKEESLNGLTADETVEGHITTHLLAMEMIWNSDYKKYLWGMLESTMEKIEAPEENREEELEIINELKKTHELKEILDKAEPTVE